MKDGGAHLGEAVGGALRARALADDEGVGDVRGVVDAEADADHQEDADEGVDGLELIGLIEGYMLKVWFG